MVQRLSDGAGVTGDSHDAAAGAHSATYEVGTLLYSRGGLINVFIWMLWGDLCLNLMEAVIPRMVPLQLQALGASNALIGILTGSLFSLLNWIMGPVISTASDRHRSRLGRRIPFMLYPTPLLALFLASIGFSGDLAGWLRLHCPGLAGGLIRVLVTVRPETAALAATAQLTIALIALALALYKFFDVFPQTVYYYLFADVIPQAVMGTFVCLFRVMATVGIVIFHYWLLPYAGSNPRLLYVICAALYLVSFTLLSVRIKEGEYPPPPRTGRHPLAVTIAWFRESFSDAFYWKYYITYACFRWAFVPFNAFLILYAQVRLKMDPGAFGHSQAIAQAMQIPVLLVLAPLLDRWHAVRLTALGYVSMMVAALAALLLIRGRDTFLIYNVATFIAIAIVQGSVLTLGPRTLPRHRYGQLCAAAAMFTESGLLVLSWLCGKLIDRDGERVIYGWLMFFGLCGFVATLSLYRAWKARELSGPSSAAHGLVGDV